MKRSSFTGLQGEVLVNLGCGAVYHPAWINLDVLPSGPGVRRWDVRRGLPFRDSSVDAIYHSHLLEHLGRDAAQVFLRDCRRALCSGGTLRVVVPDLEGIASAYLRELGTARSGGDDTLYEWCRMELFDQAARAASGGAMVPFLLKLTQEQLVAIRMRAGAEVDSILCSLRGRARRLTLDRVMRKARREVARMALKVIGGAGAVSAFDEGWFRQSGEVHRVMYDEYSLRRLLVECGFAEPRKVTASESRIPNFLDYRLDWVNGVVRKPDSLFMEAAVR